MNWFYVNDKLPEMNQVVLVAGEAIGVTVGRRIHMIAGGWSLWEILDEIDDDLTKTDKVSTMVEAWMPLPNYGAYNE
jgi:hypothetical protein